MHTNTLNNNTFIYYSTYSNVDVELEVQSRQQQVLGHFLNEDLHHAQVLHHKHAAHDCVQCMSI